MSTWSYIHGTVKVSLFGRTQHENEYILRTVLDHLPVVSGSEGDMEVDIVPVKVTTTCTTHDEFGDKTNNLRDRYGRRSYKKGWLYVQDEYNIVISSNLRDREFSETYQNFQKWLCRLAKRLLVEDVLIKISSFDKSIIIENPIIKKFTYNDTTYGQMFERFSTNSNFLLSDNDNNVEPNWCEYLMWNQGFYGKPVELEYKYNKTSKVEEEYKRRFKYNTEVN